jgi:cytidyltransferase-like protein
MRVGITVGVWDYLHDGHVNHLRLATSETQILLVGVVTDYLTKMQKGCYPDHDLETRKAAIRAQFPGALIFDLSSLTLPREVSSMVTVVYAGPDQTDRFWAHNLPHLPRRIVQRYAPGGKEISSTQLRLRRHLGDQNE